MFELLVLLIYHSVGIHHITLDFHCVDKLRDEEYVAVGKHKVFVATWIGKGLVEFDTHIIAVAQFHFHD